MKMPLFPITKNQQTFIDIQNLIPYLVPYGEFLISDITVSDTYESAHEVAFVSQTYDKEDTKRINDFLCSSGFAVRRRDIDKEKEYIELTERGRLLKLSGSLESFFKDDDRKKKLALFLDRKQVYDFAITLSIAISTGCAAIYYLLEMHSHHKYALGIFVHYATFGILLLTLVTLWRYLLKRQRKMQKKE